jgi:hypothetical protein
MAELDLSCQVVGELAHEQARDSLASCLTQATRIGAAVTLVYDLPFQSLSTQEQKV